MTGLAAVPGRVRHVLAEWRPSRRHVVVISLVLVAIVGSGSLLLLMSRAFSVREVVVAGTSRLTAADVIDAAGIRRGAPLATLDTEAAAQRVRRLPVVREVTVVRDWPRTVAIEVRERQPVAVRRDGRSFVLIDAEGVALGQVRKRPKELALISATSTGDPTGRVTRLDPQSLRAAIAVLRDVPPDVRRQVREVRASSAVEVTLRLSRGRVVMWGGPERGSRKAQVLAALVTRKAKIYDVSAPDTPTTRK